MKKINIDITGMHCQSCVTVIEKSLNKLNGVKKGVVNLTTEKATVDFDPSKVSEKQILETVSKKGYKAFLVTGKTDPRTEAKKRKAEITKLKNFFYISLVFAVPAFIVAMVLPWIGIKIPYEGYILWILATPVQFYVGLQFYQGTWAALKNKSANMDTLIAIGTSAAYFYSVYVVLFSPHLGQYFEASAMLITFVILGKLLNLFVPWFSHV